MALWYLITSIYNKQCLNNLRRIITSLSTSSHEPYLLLALVPLQQVISSPECLQFAHPSKLFENFLMPSLLA